MKLISCASLTLLTFLLLPGKASAGLSFVTWICLRNTTAEPMFITVEDIDNYDWEGLNRPDHNWHGTYVNAGTKRCERAEINHQSPREYFSFVVSWSSKSRKVRMGYSNSPPHDMDDIRWRVLVGDDPSWSPIRADQQGATIYDGWELGRTSDCNSNGRQCREFHFKLVNAP